MDGLGAQISSTCEWARTEVVSERMRRVACIVRDMANVRDWLLCETLESASCTYVFSHNVEEAENVSGMSQCASVFWWPVGIPSSSQAGSRSQCVVGGSIVPFTMSVQL